MTTDTARYSTGAMLLHWVIAIAVIVNWRIAEAAEHAASRSEAAAIMADHKALGITILLLTLARLGWRLAHPVPPMPERLAQWERVLARGVHIVFYILLIGLPLGGWLANSLKGRTVDMFGLFEWPALPVGVAADLGDAIFDVHAVGGEVLIYLAALHVLGALKNTFFDRAGGIKRMLPRWGSGN